MCTYSAGCLVISPSSGHGGAAANNIPYSIALLDAQGSTVSAVPAQEQPPQIGRLVADNHEQFRVRAVLPGKALPSGESRYIRSDLLPSICHLKCFANLVSRNI